MLSWAVRLEGRALWSENADVLALLFTVNHYVISAELSIADGIQVAQSWVQE